MEKPISKGEEPAATQNAKPFTGLLFYNKEEAEYSMVAGMKNPLGTAPYDIKSRAMGLTGVWDWRLTSKGKLPEIILPEGDFTHNALEDSQYQQPMDFALTALAIGGNYGI